MSVSVVTEGLGNVLAVEITGVASTANGGQGEIDNPEGVTVRITDAWLLVDTPSDGAANLSAGVADSGSAATDILNAVAAGSVSADDFINGFARQNTAKTAVTVPAKWTSAKKITLTASASLVGFHGYLYVRYVRQPAA